MMDINKFKEYLKIDKQALDDEVMQQPSLFYEVAQAYSEAALDRDSLKEALNTIDASLDAEARQGKDKITEAQVKAHIQLSKKHSDAFADWLDAKESADLLAALKEAFQQRSYMLRDLVSLHNSNYFEETSLKTDAATDRHVYTQRRAKLATAREARK